MLHPRFVSSVPRRLLPLVLVGVLLGLGGCASESHDAVPSVAQSDGSPSAETAPTLAERMAARDRLGHVLRRTEDLFALVRAARLVGMPVEEAGLPEWRARDQDALLELLALDERLRAATWSGPPERRLDAMLERDLILARTAEARLPALPRLIARFEQRLLHWNRAAAAR